MRHSILAFVAVLPLFAQPAAAQEKKRLPGDEMIDKYLAAETDKLAKKFLDGAKTLAEWKEKRPRLHREYMDMLGLWPLPAKTPLKATITKTFEHQGVVIECLHFQSIPGLYVTANFYRPAKASPAAKLPTILYVCGHSNKGRDGNKSDYQDHGMWFASNGYNCLVLDTLQLGEIPAVHHGTYGRPWNHLKAYEKDDPSRERKRPEDTTRWWWHSAGYTPAGVECWNGVRAIDYLLTRKEVDPDRIGVTGISGGGAATFWIAAADERVKVAVPVSGMSDLESYVKNKVVNGHCDCMFLYNTYQWDWTTIAALVAPRPLLFANSDNDPIFPMDGNRRIIAKLRQIYEMYGKPDLVDDYVSKGGHAYRPDLRIAVFKFLNKHLKGDEKAAVKDVAFEKIAGKDLRVFPTDADVPKDAINQRVDEVFVPRAKVELPEKGKFEEWRKTMLHELKAKCFRGFPERVKAASRVKTDQDLPGALLETEEGIRALLMDGRIDRVGDEDALKKLPLVLLVSDVSHSDKKGLASLKLPGSADWLILTRRVFDPWSMKSPPNYVERSHILLGQHVNVGRIRDIVAAVRFAEELEPTRKAHLWGHGEAGILAAYAALFEPSIEEVVVIDPPKSHKGGPHFLGVLRVLDIPDALGLLAPRKLTIIGGRDPAFDRTEEIYRRAGAADKLVRK